jgi:hypothetical protein
MNLEVEDGTSIGQPSDQDIEVSLARLDGSRISFATLSRDPMTYIQTAGTYESGYDLEYQDEDTEHHYRAVGSVTYDQVVSAFQRYAKGDPSWKDDFKWERQEFSRPGGSGCAGITVLGFMLMAIAAIIAVQ